MGLGVTRHAGVQTRLPGNEYICITSSELFHIIWFKHILFHIFLNTSIHLHRHYMSMLIYKRDSKKSYIAYVNSFPSVPEHQIKTL